MRTDAAPGLIWRRSVLALRFDPMETKIRQLPGVSVRFYFDDADPVAKCECGWHVHGDAAVDAFRAWWKHQADKHAEQMT